MLKARVQTGIELHDDGWRVIQDWTDPKGRVEHLVYDPPYASEAEAEAKAREAARLVARSQRATRSTTYVV